MPKAAELSMLELMGWGWGLIPELSLLITVIHCLSLPEPTIGFLTLIPAEKRKRKKTLPIVDTLSEGSKVISGIIFFLFQRLEI